MTVKIRKTYTLTSNDSSYSEVEAINDSEVIALTQDTNTIELSGSDLQNLRDLIDLLIEDRRVAQDELMKKAAQNSLRRL